MTESEHRLRHRVTELRYAKASKELKVSFEDGKSFLLPAEYLRVESPSAEIQGHSPSQKQTIGGRRHVGIMAIEPVGSYAVRIRFDDLHDTGLYSWDYLRKLGEEQGSIWADYLVRLQEKGLSREP
ncbi:MAG: DUF971 domain-containing protein [Rhodospirillales bacterium]|nr:DUF971 domain-containing protein [Rhodospirillales bacterium]